MHAFALVAFAWFLPNATFEALPRGASAKNPVVDGQAAVAVSLLSQHDTLCPGSSTLLGIHFEMSPHWHIYGANPGGAGFPTEVQFTVAHGTVGQLAFPPPHMFQENDNVFTYGYSGTALLTAPLSAATDNRQAVTVEARVRYLACNIICSPGEVTLRRTWPITHTAQESSQEQQDALAHANDAFTGLSSAQDAGHSADISLWRALALAFVGGLLLNLMPCVLPVLALKAMALTQMHHSRAVNRSHALGYGAGVVGSTLALGCAVMAIRAAGHSVGWGFQFQEPLFIAMVAVFLLLFATSCFGLFEVSHGVNAVAQAHDRASGLRRSVLEGVLAVLVATPCSAPFLGTAVAFALAQADVVIALVFIVIGAGLAAPFVLLVFVPTLGRFVPRPGAWMLHLKTVLGFCLLGTCIWLVWLFGRSRGVDDGALLLALMLVAALGAWAIGLYSASNPTRLLPSMAVWVILLAWAGRTVLQPGSSAVPAPVLAPFSDDQVAAELQAGRPVLVDFTADWCITCKYNEHHVLSSPEVQQALTRHHVTVLKADFTRRDNALLAVLLRHGRAGVPMYLLYSPNAPDQPLLLPELLHTELLVTALENL